jgi:prolyl-tRNA editing enzyme YbaK/EbsC (Cys-tRNA(Pro) deacylase)
MEDKAKEDKAKVEVEEADLTEQNKAKRRIVDDDVTCFVTLENWRAAHIGIGILVQPRTMRERYRRLIPQLELVNDYVSADAYNQGVRSVATRGGAGRDRDKAGNQHSVLSSSTRGRINAWLPLYINAANWKYVKAWAPSAFSIIATQVNDKFLPIHSVQVCARLLNQSVVKFMSGDVHLSDKAIQQYADVHRLFLEMVVEYPVIRQTASKALEDFVAKPWVRGREMTPDIGDLIQYLTVTDTVTWAEFKEAYIQESFRRNARWVDSRIPGGEARGIGPHSGDEELVEYWSEGTRVSVKLMLFNVMFLNLVARPEGVSLDDVRASYDKCWGRLTDETVDKLKIGALEISKIDTLQGVMDRIQMPSSTADIAKLIRWAYENKTEVPIPDELKKATSVTDAKAVYDSFLQQRTITGLINTLCHKAEVRSSNMGKFLSSLLAGAPSVGRVRRALVGDVLTTSVVPPIADDLLTFLRDKCANTHLVSCPGAGHKVMSRTHAFGIPSSRVLKEMVFTMGGTPILVLSNGGSDISTAAIARSLNKGSVSLCHQHKAIAATGLDVRSICAFTTIIPTTDKNNNNNNAPDPIVEKAVKAATTITHTIINTSILRLGADETVYMSAGCPDVFLCMTVGELKRLLDVAIEVAC